MTGSRRVGGTQTFVRKRLLKERRERKVLRAVREGKVDPEEVSEDLREKAREEAARAGR